MERDSRNGTSAIIAELDRKFAGSVPNPVITWCVAGAIHDLRGSISVEALPEMALRLATVRLATMRQAGIPQPRVTTPLAPRHAVRSVR